MARPAKALINLDAVKHNFALATRLAPGSKAVAVVKANAYGHGAVAVASALAIQAPAFGVACIEEAIELRDAGIEQPILLLEGVFCADEIVIASEQNFWLMVENHKQIHSIVNADISRPIVAWIKIDSGMHRLGLPPREANAAFSILQNSKNVQPGIVMATHFACSDQLDSDFTHQQVECFSKAVAGIQAPRSMANSAAILAWENARADWNRPGYMLYGNSPFPHNHENGDQLKPVMTVKSAIISIREIPAGESVGYGATWKAQRNSRIATVAIGYGDGYPRHAPNGTPVLVNGRRAPLAGRVSMDMVTVDVTDLGQVNIGDEVILWGEALPVNEVAEFSATNGYELLTRLPPRLPRVFTSQ